ncbi:MAG: carbohydrate porin [Burkholderiales bacterium]|nr:carbohydrate porin [Burkholderiales bacterium]
MRLEKYCQMRVGNTLFFVKISLVLLILGIPQVFADSESTPLLVDSELIDISESQSKLNSASISANPTAVDIITGTGVLGRTLGINPDTGIYLGGAWIGNTDYLFNGGINDDQRWTNNSFAILNFTIDAQKLMGWKGATWSTEFLQFNGQNTNGLAGSVQGYNSLPGPMPLDRSELYQLWYRQALFNDKFIFRIGKSLPSLDFDNVVKPVALDNSQLFIPAVSGLLYTPIFVNPSSLGIMPGYYNSAYGITTSYAPIKEWYVSVGAYDGSLATGTQTGMNVWPGFTGSYLYLGETGLNWLLGEDNKPGNIGVGVWSQTGPISGPPNITQEVGADGTYIFGSQRLWYKNPNIDSSGISMYFQYGINNSDALPMPQYGGAGLTFFGLIPHRPYDSFGAGFALSQLNPNSFTNYSEMMYQGYYQLQVIRGVYLEPALSYIPDPGASSDYPPAFAGTLQLIVLF